MMALDSPVVGITQVIITRFFKERWLRLATGDNAYGQLGDGDNRSAKTPWR